MERKHISWIEMFNPFLILILLSLFSKGVLAVDYYIDAAEGDNSWDGSAGSYVSGDTGPWETFQNINGSVIYTGDNVYLKCGSVWHEPLQVVRESRLLVAGTINITSYGDCNNQDNPEINLAFADLVDPDPGTAGVWELYQDNIYRTSLTSIPDAGIQVVVDETYIPQAHYFDPVTGDHFSNDVESTYNNLSTQRNIITDNDLTLPNIPVGAVLNGAEVFVRNNSWTISGYAVTNYVYDSGTSTIALGDMAIDNGDTTTYNIRAGQGYYLRNKLWMLNYSEGWFYREEDGIKYLYLRLPDNLISNGGADPDQHDVQVSQHDTGIYIQNYRGLTDPDPSVTSDEAITVENIKISHAAKYGVHLHLTTGVELNNIEVIHSGVTGIYGSFEGANVNRESGIVFNSTVKNSVRDGIKLENLDNVVIQQNTVENSGTIGLPVKSWAAIDSTAAYNTAIVNNTVSNSGHIGIRFNRDSNISNNHIIDSCVVLDDCGAIVTWKHYADLVDGTCLATTGQGSTVSGNIIDGVIGGIEGNNTETTDVSGIYLDDWTCNVTVSNNTVIGSDRSVFLHNANNNTISNNILFGGRRFSLSMTENGTYKINQIDYTNNGKMHSNEITGNTFLPLSRNEVINLDGAFSNIKFGDFNDNMFATLYDNPVSKEQYFPSALMEKNDYNMFEWITRLDNQGHPDDSETSTPDRLSLLFNPFPVMDYKNLIASGENYINNGDFESIIDWDSTDINKIKNWLALYPGVSTDGIYWSCADADRCLEFSNTEMQDSKYIISNQGFGGGVTDFPLNSDVYYLLELSMQSNIDGLQIPVTIRENVPNYTLTGLTENEFFKSSTTWKNYSYAFKSSHKDNIDIARLEFEVLPSTTLSLDDVVIKQVALSKNDANDDAYIFTNPGDSVIQVACPDEWVNVNSVPACNDFINLEGMDRLSPQDNIDDLPRVIWPLTLPARGSQIIVSANNSYIGLYNCTDTVNYLQDDQDTDRRPDSCDNCTTTSNFDQADLDGDGAGDACDGDIDNDSLVNNDDNCPFMPNLDQADFDGDGEGDVCDNNIDNDAVDNILDCNDYDPFVYPGNIEIPGNGQDDDCVGDDSTIVATATFSNKRGGTLIVRAVSDQGINDELTVEGYPTMEWKSTKKNGDHWELDHETSVNPGTVDITGIDGTIRITVD